MLLIILQNIHSFVTIPSVLSQTMWHAVKNYPIFQDLFYLPIEKALRLLLSRDILFEQFVLFISRRGEDTRKLQTISSKDFLCLRIINVSSLHKFIHTTNKFLALLLFVKIPLMRQYNGILRQSMYVVHNRGSEGRGQSICSIQEMLDCFVVFISLIMWPLMRKLS